MIMCDRCRKEEVGKYTMPQIIGIARTAILFGERTRKLDLCDFCADAVAEFILGPNHLK